MRSMHIGRWRWLLWQVTYKTHTVKHLVLIQKFEGCYDELHKMFPGVNFVV